MRLFTPLFVFAVVAIEFDHMILGHDNFGLLAVPWLFVAWSLAAFLRKVLSPAPSDRQQVGITPVPSVSGFRSKPAWVKHLHRLLLTTAIAWAMTLSRLL